MTQEQPSDEGWVRLAQAGDRAAFAHLVRRHQNAVHRFITRMLGSQDEALELTQETFIKAWQALPQWQPQAQFRTWIYRIASNAAMDVLRRRKIVEMIPLQDDFDAPTQSAGPEAQLATRQRMRTLEAALAALPAEQREVIVLREVEELSYAEIAATLDLQEGTVKSRLARAREALASAVRRAEA